MLNVENLGPEEMRQLFHKKCCHCNKVKYYSHFQPKRRRGTTKPNSRCRDCQAKVDKKSYSKRKDCPLRKAAKAAYDSSRARTARNPYYRFVTNSIRSGTPAVCTEHEFYAHYEKTQCDVCAVEFEGNGMTQKCIDHCHETGRIRGALCRRCNSAEGYIRGIENAKRLVEYLEGN